MGLNPVSNTKVSSPPSNLFLIIFILKQRAISGLSILSNENLLDELEVTIPDN